MKVFINCRSQYNNILTDCLSFMSGKIHNLPNNLRKALYKIILDLMYVYVWVPAPLILIEGLRHFGTIIISLTQLPTTIGYFCWSRSLMSMTHSSSLRLADHRYDKKIRVFWCLISLLEPRILRHVASTLRPL